MASAFSSIIGAHLVTFYTGSSDGNAHSPNEFLRVQELERMRDGFPLLLEELAKVL